MATPKESQPKYQEHTLLLNPQGQGLDRTIRLEGKTATDYSVGVSEVKKAWQRYRPLPGGPDHRTVPGCTLEAVLGHGGMGAVYLGRQDRLDRPVAVKVLNGDLANNPEFIALLRQEARILGAMAHPNVVTCHDVIVSKNGASLVMEYVPGQLSGRNVVQLLGPMPERYVVEVLLGVARALSYAHDKGFTHRDVKPDNILFAFDAKRPPANYDELFHYPNFRVALCDFGIAAANAKLTEHSGKKELALPVMGSPLYMAPEQAAMPEKMDFRADIYALGCTGYYLLTGAPPFTGKDWNEILNQKVDNDLPAPQSPVKGAHFSPELLRILARMGKVVPEERYADYAALLHDLGHLSEVFAERDRSFRTFLYAHQRQLSILCATLLLLLLSAVGGLNYYTHWLQGYAKRMDTQKMNPYRWEGERNGWQQRLDEGTMRPMLIGVRGAGAITLEDILRPGDFVHLLLGCDNGSISIQLKERTERAMTIGRISLRRDFWGEELRYHLGINSFYSDMSDGIVSRVPTPAHFPDELAQWVELRIELYDGFYCVWCHNQLLGVGHFDPANGGSGYSLEVGPVNCDRVMFRNILVVEKKIARQLRKW